MIGHDVRLLKGKHQSYKFEPNPRGSVGLYMDRWERPASPWTRLGSLVFLIAVTALVLIASRRG